MNPEEIVSEIDRRVIEDDFDISDHYKYLPVTVAEWRRWRGTTEVETD